MKIGALSVSNSKKNSYKARLSVVPKDFLTEEQLKTLSKKSEKIGQKTDSINFKICKINKEVIINLSDGIKSFNKFTRKLYVSHNINGLKMPTRNIMSHLSEVTEKPELNSDSELNSVFEYIDRYIDNLAK